MQHDLKHTLAIITGAGKGNGSAIAKGFQNAGAAVIGVDISFPEPESFIEIEGDVTQRYTIDKTISELEKHSYSNLVLINNAGITLPNPSPYPIESWNKTLAVNLTAPFLWIESLIPFFNQSKSGSIINITSLGAELAFPNNPSYIASKGGLKMLGKYYARSLGPTGIRVNNVGPGYMKTDMTIDSFNDTHIRKNREKHTLLGRWGEPDDLVGICLFLSSNTSSYITGQDIYIDGGWTANGLIYE